MNIAFFLLPKEEVAFLKSTSTIRQALEKLEHHRYTAVPVLDEKGRYSETLTEGDLLWTIKNTPGLTFETSHRFSISGIQKDRVIKSVYINAEMEDLLSLIATQNFVPVVDDQGVFIGIVRRSDIIEYCSNQLFAIKGT
ncbi:CBS domain-containing protein [Fictibacillus sp. WQ 8-8]|uniref:CBS domain-containing protein n=1 Tax=unclassified Fictibacillus TaxID=2644029 RepID=UPI0006A7D200|nr:MULTISPECIES: CBS domain-containing protein [unclassified Fictibacillus]MCQ6266924.1 CBS domain-containing protein [Fictibacillus sp. WQ 8-8]MED2973957.1 CBS domain-containing protein [Fictibacillus sp. B-59209]UZJ78084.1 CBS domain-containing protein [Fictibacillus sp. KU28468]SFE17647.1 CBS domain-containing protein [Bacillus sp. OV194]